MLVVGCAECRYAVPCCTALSAAQHSQHVAAATAACKALVALQCTPLAPAHPSTHRQAGLRQQLTPPLRLLSSCSCPLRLLLVLSVCACRCLFVVKARSDSHLGPMGLPRAHLVDPDAQSVICGTHTQLVLLSRCTLVPHQCHTQARKEQQQQQGQRGGRREGGEGIPRVASAVVGVVECCCAVPCCMALPAISAGQHSRHAAAVAAACKGLIFAL
jgi:hypothetical protein